MKRAAAAKSCGSTVSAKSKSAPLPPGWRSGDHEFVCGEQKYRLTRQASELRQYRWSSAVLLAKYIQVYHLKFIIRFTSAVGVTTKYSAISSIHAVSVELRRPETLGQKLNFASRSNE
jgi:hypothetical protein